MKAEAKDKIRVLRHSAIRIEGSKILYFDPFHLEEEPHDADVVFVTHDHHDHFSPDDIRKIANEKTVYVMPLSTVSLAMDAGFPLEKMIAVEPDEDYCIAGLTVTAVPAYNVGKSFHEQSRHFVGYLVELDGVSYYVAGDTDVTDDAGKVRCDVALVPVGGKYTMTAEEAAVLVNMIEPYAAVPTHYGDIVGSAADAERFETLVREPIKVWR